jgi:hypothetical protein
MSFTLTPGFSGASNWDINIGFATTVTITDTTTGSSGGTFPANSYVVAFFFADDYNASGSQSSIIGGQAATPIGVNSVGSNILAFAAKMPGTAQTDTISITDNTDGFSHDVGGFVYVVTGGAVASYTQNYGTNYGSLDSNHGSPPSDPFGLATFNATDQGGAYGSLISLTVPAGGFGIVAVFPTDNQSAPTWTNCTNSAGDINNTITGTSSALLNVSLASTITSGSWQPKVAGATPYSGSPGFGAAMLAATFAPSPPGLVLALPRRIFVRR